MSAPVTFTPLATYRNETPYPFCPGCGHGPILDHLDRALRELALDPSQVVLVSDIGCSGLSDQYFDTQAFHGLHGRSLTYASGVKLARPDLNVIVLLGDGGTGIGGAHLLAAARRNLDLTVVVFNNFNFGMTGGQHSGTTPTGALTSTTPDGNLERPLDLCATVAAAGAAFEYRGTNFDADLGERIAEGILHPGLSLIDVWEPCTAHFAPRNRLNRKAIFDLVDSLGFRLGRIRKETTPEYGAAYRAAAARVGGASGVVAEGVEPRFTATLDRPFRLVLAGAAGGRVGSAARTISRAALLAGLYAAQRADYPVTVKTGYSLAELVLAPEPIDDASVLRADALVILSAEGRKQAARYLGGMAAGDRIFVVPDLEPMESAAVIERIDPGASATRIPRDAVSLAVATAAVARLGILPAEALRAAAEETGGSAAVEAGLELARHAAAQA